MKKIAILCCLFLSFILPAHSNELADDYFDIAQNYAVAGDTTKALEYVNYVLMINPKYSKAVTLKNKLIPQ